MSLHLTTTLVLIHVEIKGKIIFFIISMYFMILVYLWLNKYLRIGAQ